MGPAERLVKRLAACGYRVDLHADGPHLIAERPEAFVPPKLMAELKANRTAVIAHLAAGPEPTACDLCGAWFYCRPHEVASLVANMHTCHRGGVGDKRKDGVVVTPGVPRCPHMGGSR